MADVQDFTIELIDPVQSRVAQVQNDDDEWEDIDLPLAEVVEQLRAEINNLQSRQEAVASAVQALAVELPDSGNARAQNLLFTQVEREGGRIDILSETVTALSANIATRATAAALAALTTRVSENEGDITTHASDITALQTALPGKADGSALAALVSRVSQDEDALAVEQASIDALQAALDGVLLGPDPNTFNSFGGTRADAEAQRNQEAISNPDWIAGYNADSTLHIRLIYGSPQPGMVYQYRAGGQWRVRAADPRAATSALSALTSRVAQNEGDISANATDITSLEAELATKAAASALMALTARVEATETGVMSNAQSVTTLEASLGSGIQDLALVVDRLTFQVTAAQARQLNPLLAAGAGLVVADTGGGGQSQRVAQTVKREGNKFIVTLNPGFEWPGGALDIQPVGLQSAIRLGRNEAAPEDVDAAGEWAIEEDQNIPALAQVQEILEARVSRAENVDGSTTLSQLARWLVKTRVGDIVGGIGLYNDGSKVDLIAQADRFAVVPPGWTGNDDDVRVPFAVIDGKVYLDVAAIREASITRAALEEAIINRALIADAAINAAKIEKLDVFDIAAAGEIKSVDYVPSGTTTTNPAVAASIDFQGITFTHNTAGVAGNAYQVDMEWRREAGAAVSVVTRNGGLNIILRTQGTGVQTWDRAAIVSAVNASNAPVTASGTGNISIDTGAGGTTTDTDTIYIRATAAPGASGGGTNSENHLPSGWSRTNPGPTATENVYRQTRTRTYTGGSFTSATAWGNVSKVADATGTADTTPPALSSATVNGATLVLTYDESLDGNSVPAVGDFNVLVAGARRTVSTVAVSGTTVTLTLSSAAANGDTVTVAYTAGTNPIQDGSGNDAAGLSNQAVTNNTPATPVDPPTSGNSVDLTLPAGSWARLSSRRGWFNPGVSIPASLAAGSSALSFLNIGFFNNGLVLLNLDGRLSADMEATGTLEFAGTVGGTAVSFSLDVSDAVWSSGAQRYTWTNQQAIYNDLDYATDALGGTLTVADGTG